MSKAPKSRLQSKNTETTKRRKSQNKSATNSVSLGAAKVQDGETIEDVIHHLSSLPSKKNMYDAVTGHARITADGFVKNIEKNYRLPVPIHEKRRVKLEKDEDYLPAQYVKLENSEYVITQAPVKQNHRDIWRLVWQDQIKIMVCLCHDDQIGDDDKKCFPYFQMESGASKEFENKKGKFIVNCKNKEGLSMGVTKYEFEMSTKDGDEEKSTAVKEDDPTGASAGGKVLAITMFHMNGWSGKAAEKEPFENAANVALLCKEVFKAEMAVLRKSMENFVPPVLIQSFDGIYRAAIVWVNLMLMKDVEKRECFDVPELIRKIMKMRPGSLSTYHSFCFSFAVALHVGKEATWLSDSEMNSRIGDLTKGYNDRKLSEQGIPL